MWRIILILSVTSCHAATEFSSRPTNVGLQLMDLTNKELNIPTFLGPFGVWSLMAGLSFGALGETYAQILKSCLLLPDKDTFNMQYKNLTETLFNSNVTGVRVSSKNYLFIDNRDSLVLPNFKSNLINHYNTKVITLDFQDPNTASVVNQEITAFSPYVENIFDENDFKEAKVIMSNILFFESNWSVPFNEADTIKEGSDSEGNEVSMMSMRVEVPYIYMDDVKATVIELAFGNDGKFCMLVIVPDRNVRASDVFENLEKLSFRTILGKLQSREILLYLPKFVLKSKIQLRKPLQDMGIHDAFDPLYARFPKMSSKPIHIETIEHNTEIIVNESGVVAYATTPGVRRGSYSAEQTSFLPSSILFIVEKPTATILFGGIFSK